MKLALWHVVGGWEYRKVTPKNIKEALELKAKGRVAHVDLVAPDGDGNLRHVDLVAPDGDGNLRHVACVS